MTDDTITLPTVVVLVAGGGSVRVAHALHQPQGVGSVGRLPAVAVAGGGTVAVCVVGVHLRPEHLGCG